MNTSMPIATARAWRARIISRPVRSPTWASGRGQGGGGGTEGSGDAARRPCSSRSGLEAQRRIDDDAGRQEANVQVGQGDGDEARPGPALVEQVEPGRPPPEAVAHLSAAAAREAVELPADEVPQRVTRQRIAREERHVDRHDRGSPAAPPLPAVTQGEE